MAFSSGYAIASIVKHNGQKKAQNWMTWRERVKKDFFQINNQRMKQLKAEVLCAVVNDWNQ